MICIAPNYKRTYDLHAVQMMGANIELWAYRLFRNDTLYLEEIFQTFLSVAVPTVRPAAPGDGGRTGAQCGKEGRDHQGDGLLHCGATL